MSNPNLRINGLFVALAASLMAVTGFGFEESKLREIDREIRAAIGRAEIPGAVFRIETKGDHVYEKAYGRRAIRPKQELMTPDTVFDAASLTKVLATSPSICLLADRKQLDLDDPIVKHLAEFAPEPELRPLFRKFDTSADSEKNRAKVTIRQLLTHTSGLPPSISIRTEPWWGHDNGIRRCLTTPLIKSPGTKFRYSDVNYILLGEIVRRVSGRRLDEFAAAEVFAPLGMTDTGFLPADEKRGRIAPTEEFAAYGVLRGEVHDPVSRRMQGVAGHAGLFTTATDVSHYARSFFNGNSPVFSPEMTAEMTRPHTSKSLGARRGLGWDVDSPFSYQRGENFPIGGFGHTGWTGTSIWADPGTETTVILMANRNHPSEKGRIKQLRIKVGTLAAQSVGLMKKQASIQSNPVDSATEPASVEMTVAAGDPPVLNGIDVLAAGQFSSLQGLRVGLITNHTGIDRKKRTTIDLLHQAEGVTLVALFAPEHGIRGKLDQAKIDDGVDTKTGLPIYSLYKSKSRKPTASQLAGLDALVFDIQDIGCRFYTYISTMGKAMEAAAEHDLDFIVLDRVNPIGGAVVDGPVRIGESKFTAYHDIPVQHGMTVGELAKLFVAEKKLKLDLTVIPLQGWSREMRFDETGLPWVNPSPNMRNLTEAILYPGIGLLEFCQLSVGRGTDRPFEVIGAPYIDGKKLAAELSSAGLPGIRFKAVTYTPSASIFSGKQCGGVDLKLTDPDSVRPIDAGLTIAKTLYRLYPGDFNLEEKFNFLLMHPPTLRAVAEGRSLSEIRKGWEPALSRFRERRAAVLIY